LGITFYFKKAHTKNTQIIKARRKRKEKAGKGAVVRPKIWRAGGEQRSSKDGNHDITEKEAARGE